MKRIMILLDGDYGYGNRLAEYINNKGSFPYIVRAESDIDGLEKMDMAMVDLICTDYSFYSYIRDNYKEKLIIIMEGDERKYWEQGDLKYVEESSIFKYKRCDEIIRDILNKVSVNKGKDSLVNRGKELKIYGFFSPISRAGQTTMALTIGQIMAKRGRSLYLNLNCFEVLGEIFDNEHRGDLSDLLYIMNTEGTELASYIGSLSYNLCGLDVIAPMSGREEIISIGAKEWLEMIRNLEERTAYEYLILDLSAGVQGFWDILKLCDYIWTATIDQDNYRKKVEEWYMGFDYHGLENMKERIKTFYLPPEACINIEPHKLLYGEAGRVGRLLINE